MVRFLRTADWQLGALRQAIDQLGRPAHDESFATRVGDDLTGSEQEGTMPAGVAARPEAEAP